MPHSPPFTDEELVLLLDTYRRVGSENITADHPWVEWLSQVLRELPIHPTEKRPEDNESFRPPEGLRSRLSEFRRIEEGTNSRTLHAYRSVWAQYGEDEEALRAAAEAILEKYDVERPPDEKNPLDSRVDTHSAWGEEGGIALQYNQRVSSFYPACKEAIEGSASNGRVEGPVQFDFKQGGGYDGSVRVRIDPSQPDQFRSDWDGSDPSRFPARIRAAATALRDCTGGGIFRITHEDGQLTIEPTSARALSSGGDSTGTAGDDFTGRTDDIRAERRLRTRLWEDLIDHGGPHGVTSRVVRDVGLYKGQAGIWADKSRTADLTPNGQGITVSVLHTGSAYDDDLDEDGLLYHYPDTNRPGRHDANEVEATKNAARFGLPIFVITYPDPNASTRNVKRGWVEDWDDQARTFLIRFSDKDNTEGAPGTRLQMPLSPERGDKGQEGEEPFQLTDSSPNGEMAERPTRPGQSRFKFHVVKRYGPCCVVCDVDIEAMLDACHLREKKDRGSDHSGNGLVLCANHHRAFDSGLFAIEPGTLTVHMQDGLDREDIGLTRTSIDHLERPPHPEALQWRWEKWTKEE
jgi:hypothetical protein